MSDLHPVLLVEDDPVIAKTLGMSLRYQGFEVTIAHSVRDALKQLAARSFSLIMLDVGLPDGSGIDLCRTLRKRDAQVPILMLTARTDEKSAIESIDGGADDCGDAGNVFYRPGGTRLPLSDSGPSSSDQFSARTAGN